MRRALCSLSTIALFSVATGLYATSFVVPSDTTFIAKANAIVIGTVEQSSVDRDGVDAPIETVYDLRVERVLKGAFQPGEVVSVVSPGGESGGYALYVPGAASFTQGQRVLLFLTRHKRHWEATDMMLGKFSYSEDSRGARVLLRGEDSVDPDAKAAAHGVDRVRSEHDFVNFIQDVVSGRPVAADYFVDEHVSANSTPVKPRPVTLSYADYTYTQVGSGPGGVRWPTSTISSALNFERHTGCSGCDPTNASTFITNGMAAWNNDCASNVNLQLIGTTATAAKATTADCGDVCDFKNVFEFGDPNNNIAGSWTGSGTVGVTYIVYSSTAGGNAGASFREIVDADIIFQDGYDPNAQSAAPQAVTHELGHSIGWRHSNADPSTPNGQTENCNASTAECAGGGFGGNAIMFWTVSSLGYTLQTWDQNAIRAVYPGGSCSGPTAPTNVVATATSATSVSVSWTASSGGTITYQVQRSASGTGGFANTGTSTSLTNFTDSIPSTAAAYLYRVVATNSNGSATSSYDLATNVIFTNTTLTAQSSTIQAADINELRTAVRAVQTLAGQTPTSFGTAVGGSTTIMATDVTSLRTALDAARSALVLSSLSYAEGITGSTTFVKASHFTELRAGVQ